MEKILVTIGERFSQEGKQILSELGDAEYLDCDREKLLTSIEGTTVLIVGLGHIIDKEVIDKASNLKMIATATTGTDHIDLEYADSKNIAVVSLKDETEFLQSITSTAELSLELMIALARNTHSAVESVKGNEWDRDAHEGHTLSGKTLGIVGLGRLGKLMAKYGKALGMEVVFTDPNVDSTDFENVTFQDLLKRSDVISIHAHLTDETKNMFNAEAFEQMKPAAYLVNTSRGQIVDESALISALESKKLAGYATDVLADELEFEERVESSLIDYAKKHSNVIITPHVGGMTEESRAATDTFIAKKIQSSL